MVEQKFPLFRMDHSCDCVKAKKVTKTVRAAEIRTGKPGASGGLSGLLPIFLSDRTSELFRIEVGRDYGGQLVKLWNYGIAEEADFNGDGKPDYSWYGGDDTSSGAAFFLSTADGYQRIDVLKTAKAAWRRRYHSKSPDIEDSDCEYGMGRRSASALSSRFDPKSQRCARPNAE